MEKPQTWFAQYSVLTHLTGESYRCVCFLLVYLLLLKIIANAIIKAIAMIVIPINA